jgi:hypothetical protein
LKEIAVMPENVERPTAEAADDDDVVDRLPVLADIIGVSLSTLNRLIAKGQGPPVLELSERRKGSMRRHWRPWLASRTRWPKSLNDNSNPPAIGRDDTSKETRT